MNNQQVEELIKALQYLAKGVNKIGDGVKSIAFYIWLPIYLGLLALFIGGCILAFFSLG